MHILKIAVSTLLLLSLTKGTSANQDVLTNVSPPSPNISSLEVTPWAILSGEQDSRAWLYPYNGIYYSEDLGLTWQNLGLESLGISDIRYFDSTIYATTLYNNNGLYKSTNKGQTWLKIGPQFSATNVEVTQNAIYLGGSSHGLWISYDNGLTWVHKLGYENSNYGPKVINITSENNIVLVSTNEGSYISTDNGVNLTKLDYFNQKNVSKFLINKTTYLAATDNNKGLHVSSDNGINWTSIDFFNDTSVTCLGVFKDTYYAGYLYRLYKSKNLNDWAEIDTGITTQANCNSFKFIHSDPNYAYISFGTAGVYRLDISNSTFEIEPFLNIPYETTSNNLLSKITAFFDHKYPLLGYSLYSEPIAEQDTVLNFLGQKESIPKLYYSSHNGTDFSLDYGAKVLAAEDGVARYYYCNDCGHSIKITHNNGYETTYMHLQKKDILTLNSNANLPVKAGDTIGLVGLSGKSTGPHLHFSVSKTSKTYPSNLVDPFSWQVNGLVDPWEIYSWNDSAGEHTGSKSNYLWNFNLDKKSEYNSLDLSVDNVNLSLNDNSDVKKTITLTKYKVPYLPFSQANLTYLGNSSFVATATDHYGNDIANLNYQVEINIDFSRENLSNILTDTLKVYFYNKIQDIWEPLPTVIDLANKTLTAITDHFSLFAVFGNSKYPISPSSTLIATGAKNNGWFTEFPLIEFSSTDYTGLGIKNVYYSLNNGTDWEVYSQPFYHLTNRASTILYKAQDNANNFENTNSYVIKNNFNNDFTDSLNVSGAIFSFN